MQTFNYHMHTKRCGHAIGEDREYIEAAIEAGFQEIGFSEHMAYPGWDDPKERLFYDSVDEYLTKMKQYQEEYKDQIKIDIGFEFEFFEDQLEHIQSMKDKVDYMIVGQHAKDFNTYYELGCSDEDVEMYASQIVRALDLKLTKYVAHIDYFMLGRENVSARVIEAVNAICDAVNRNQAVIEINLKGMNYGKKVYDGRSQYIYPHYDIFKNIAIKQCPIVFGYDAHYPKAMKEQEKIKQIKEDFKDLNLNYTLDFNPTKGCL